MRRPIDDSLERMPSDHVRVMNKNTPEVHKHEESEIEPAVQRKEEDEQMIWHRLQVTVEGMKGMRCEGSRDQPLMVPLMDILVN